MCYAFTRVIFRNLSKTIRPSDDQLDLVVNSFNACVRKLMLGCGENTCHIPLYLFPEFTKLWNPASLCPGHPFAQKLADTLISRFQRETEIFLQQISPVQPWIRCREKLQLLLLMFGEILWILELRVSRSFNIFSKLLFRRFGFSFFRTSDMTFLHFFGCTISLRPGSSPDFVQRVGCL